MNDEGPRYRRSPAGAVALTALALGLGGWGILNSPLFEIRHIEVLGARHLSAGEVILQSGIEAGENLVRVSPEDAAASVERLPWVADAAVERDLPSTLMLRVVERTAAGWFRDADGIAVVARDGMVLERDGGRPAKLPALGTWSGTLVPGDPVPAIPAPLRVAASMDRALLGHIRSGASAGPDVNLELRGGGTVHYGTPTLLGDKNRALAEMIEWAADEGIVVASIDVRIPASPSLRPIGSAPPGPS